MPPIRHSSPPKSHAHPCPALCLQHLNSLRLPNASSGPRTALLATSIVHIHIYLRLHVFSMSASRNRRQLLSIDNQFVSALLLALLFAVVAALGRCALGARRGALSREPRVPPGAPFLCSAVVIRSSGYQQIGIPDAAYLPMCSLLLHAASLGLHYSTRGPPSAFAAGAAISVLHYCSTCSILPLLLPAPIQAERSIEG